MSEWMWYSLGIFGMILGAACFFKWTDAKVQIEKILKEELKNDNENNSKSG